MNSYATAAMGRQSKTIFGFALLALLLPAVPAFAQSANLDFKRGQQAEAHEDYDTAYLDYQKAFQREPQDVRFRLAFDRVRTTDSDLHLTRGRHSFPAGQSAGRTGGIPPRPGDRSRQRGRPAGDREAAPGRRAWNRRLTQVDKHS